MWLEQFAQLLFPILAEIARDIFHLPLWRVNEMDQRAAQVIGERRVRDNILRSLLIGFQEPGLLLDEVGKVYLG